MYLIVDLWNTLNNSVPCFLEDTSASWNTVYIVNTTFTNNSCFIDEFCSGGGIFIYFTEGLCHATHVYLKDTIFVENYGSSIFASDLQVEDTKLTNLIRIEDSMIKNSVGLTGAGMTLSIWSAPPMNRTASQQSASVPLKLDITGSCFVGNEARAGGGIDINTFTNKAELIIVDSIFLHNTAGKGAAISLFQFGNRHCKLHNQFQECSLPTSYFTIKFFTCWQCHLSI